MHKEDKDADCGCGGHEERHAHRGHHGMEGCPGAGFSNRFMRPYILLLLAEEPAHGYELMSRLSDFGVAPGSTDPSILYRVLRMMEMRGLTSSTLDPSGSGPARKVYRLTDEGHEVLSMWAAQLQETSSVFAKFADRYKKLSAKK